LQQSRRTYTKIIKRETFMKKLKAQLCSASVAYIVMSASPAMAQETQTSQPAQPNQAQAAPDINHEIVVTANKRQENINKVGLTITAVSGTQLAERKVSSLEDIASLVPGLAYSPSTANTPIFTLRGVGFNESSLGVYPAVSVYIDQAPLSFPVLASHSAYDLERVEVLKGPQGTLFGQNSTGGAINYIAAKPTRTFEAGGDISYGRFNQVEGNAYISGPITDTLRGRISITGLNSDPWQYSVSRGDKRQAGLCRGTHVARLGQQQRGAACPQRQWLARHFRPSGAAVDRHATDVFGLCPGQCAGSAVRARECPRC
jgi:outer membrane receptor protein involved in Fe transport